jgi:hypothetical protein
MVATTFALRAGAQEPSPDPKTIDASPTVETDIPTILSIGAASYTLAAVVHEGLGHGAGCAIGGSKPSGVSLALAQCDERGMTPGGVRWLTAGGAGANLLAGTAFASTLLLAPPKDGNAYYFLWLSSVVNLYQTAGYMMVGPWIPVGDFGTDGFLRNVRSPLPAQIGISALGAGLTAGTLFLGNKLAEPLLGDEPGVRSKRMWTTTLLPYLAGSTLVAGSSLLNRDGPGFAASAAIANFAGTLFLAYTPLFFKSDTFHPWREPGSRAMSMPRNPLWIAIGVATAATAILVLGPGVGPGFKDPHPFDPFR